MKILYTLLIVPLFIWNGAFSQTPSGYTEKVRVYIEYNTGKMYSQGDVEGNFNSWQSGLHVAPYKESNDTIYTYLIEDEEEYIKLIQKKSMAILGDSVNLEFFVELTGDKYSVENLEGKVIVLNFWFKDCRPCLEELPELNRLSQGYNNEDVIFLAPTFNTEEEVNSFLTNREFLYNVLLDAKPLIKEYKVVSFPTHVLIDRNGIIKFYKIGAVSQTIYSILDTEIKKLL